MNKEDTKVRAIIINTAEQLFSAHGISGTSIEDISAKSKIPVTVIYQHYVNKDAVVNRVVNRIIRKLKSTLLLHVRKVNNISPAFILQFSFIEYLVKYRSLFAEKELRNYEESWIQFMNFRNIYAKNVIEINLSDYNVRKMLTNRLNSKGIASAYLDYIDTLIFNDLYTRHEAHHNIRHFVEGFINSHGRKILVQNYSTQSGRMT